MAAMILPNFHVAHFDIEECNKLPVDVAWSLHDGTTKNKTLFPEKNNFPSVKSMTFEHRKDPMDVAVAYTSEEGVVKGIPTLLSRYHIEIPEPKHEKFSLKLRVKLDQNGIPGLDTAELIEEFKEEKKIAVKGHSGKTEKKEGEEDKKEEPEQQFEVKLVDKTTATNIDFKWETHGFSHNQIVEFGKLEDEMFTSDRKIIELKEMKNHLESYIYEMRAHLDTYGDRAKYCEDSVREQFLQTLQQEEEWLYGEGANSTKEQYRTKLDALKAVGEPVNNRFRFHDLYVVKIP